tara:strand:+ start:403 stop:633 length:231 start_codon:yes stop_codon:yes gene_type:complete
MLRFINIPVFLVSLTIGLAFVYFSSPTHNVVMVYPTPENYNKLQYKDKIGTCFQFVPMLTKCPDNVSEIKNIPIQN